ncbi:MAG: HesA/MoeB/ThiF family protein, partial [Nanoarchaeota archaeon]
MVKINRYNRQELLKEMGKNSQALLKKSSIAIIGVGALGTTTANLLARAGVGNVGVCDRDIIELHNLQRQTIFTEEDCNKPKAGQAAIWLQKVNSEITVEAFPEEINYESIIRLKKYDLILDCTDNMETRFLINDFCIKENKPWIYCSAVGTKGRLLTIIPNKTPCFRCLFALPKPGSLETCDTTGVLNTITTAMAAMEVTEAIKILTKQPATKELVAFDIW